MKFVKPISIRITISTADLKINYLTTELSARVIFDELFDTGNDQTFSKTD